MIVVKPVLYHSELVFRTDLTGHFLKLTIKFKNDFQISVPNPETGNNILRNAIFLSRDKVDLIEISNTNSIDDKNKNET